MEKFTLDEIRAAARNIHDDYYENGYNSAREKADIFIGEMTMHGNNDKDSKYEFEKYSGLSYDR